MSILSAIKNFAYDVFGIENDTKTKAANDKKAQKTNTPVIQIETQEKNEDIVQISNTPQKAEPKKNLGQIKQSIEMKCQANGINFRELLKNIGQVANLSKEDFENISESEKEEILNFLSFTIDKVIEQKKKYGASNETKTEEIVITRAKNAYSAVQTGSFKDANEFEKELGDVNAELGEDFKKVSIKERRSRIERNRTQHKRAFEARLQTELSKLPESERAEAEQRLRAQYSFIQRGRFIDIINVNDSETALNAIPMLSSQDIGFGAEVVMQTRSTEAERTRTADKADFEFFEGLAQSYYNFGEELQASSVESYTQTMTQYKSAEALDQYQADYASAREKYESGENTPPYMTKEIFTATAKGIGLGASLNVNMTSAQKAEFLNRWEKDAVKFNDTKIIEEVKKQLENQPEVKEKLAALKKQENNSQTSKNYTTKVIPESGSNQKLNSVKSSLSGAKSYKSNQEDKSSLEKTNSKPLATNPIVTAKTIKKNGLEKAKEIYSDKEIIETVLNNQELTYLRPQVASMINSYSVQDLANITEGCSTSAFLFVLRNISPEKASELYESKKDLCYAGRKLGEQIIEKDNAA